MTQSLVIGLGSSDIDGLNYFRKALRAIKQIQCLCLDRVSSIYRSDALLPADAPANWQKEYRNAAPQNLELIRRAKEFHRTKAPLCYGHSRKSYLQTLFQVAADQRDLETGVLAGYLTFSGVEFIRVHRLDIVARVIKSAISVHWEPQFRW